MHPTPWRALTTASIIRRLPKLTIVSATREWPATSPAGDRVGGRGVVRRSGRWCLSRHPERGGRPATRHVSSDSAFSRTTLGALGNPGSQEGIDNELQAAALARSWRWAAGGEPLLLLAPGRLKPSGASTRRTHRPSRPVARNERWPAAPQRAARRSRMCGATGLGRD